MSTTRDEATPAEPLRPRLAARLAALAVPILFAVLAFQPLRGPSPRGANAPSAEFSAARAMVHVRALALAPRVPGTEHHRRSRRYLMERLRALGVEPELQTGRLVRADDRGRVRILTPVNVLARLEGSGRGDEAVLLVAHYDSVAQSPGAGDNAAAVAALLETLRALRTGPPPERDVIVLFSDIEEEGLAGATVFAQEHPWSEEVALVLNFEARGSAGPSLLFETGAGTASTLDGLGDDAPHLFGSSYSDDVYRALPYGTDFTVFRQRGLPGFNFAFIGGRSTYHSPTDVPERLSPASLQHHGSQALGLARRWAGAGLPSAGGEAVYFNLPWFGVVAYSAGSARAAGAVIALAALAVVVLAMLRRRVRPGETLLLVAALLAVVGLTALLAYAAVPLLMPLAGGEGDYLGDGTAYAAAWSALAAALALLAGALIGRRRRPSREPAAAVLLTWALLTAASSLAAPGSSFLAAWPCLALLLAAAPWMLREPRPGSSGARQVAAYTLATLPLLLLWMPALYLIALAVPPEEVYLTAPLAALAATLLVPLWRLLAGRRAISAAALLLLAAAVAAVSIAAAAGPSALHPREASLIYAWDDTGRSAFWTTLDLDPAPVVRRLLPEASPLEEKPELFEGYPLRVFVAPAPASPVAAPRVELVSIEPQGANRTVRLRLRSRRPSGHLNLELEGPPGSRVVSVDGEPVEPPAADPDFFTLRFVGATQEDHEVELRVPAGGEVRYNAADRTYDLPAGLAGEVAAPPDDTVLLPMTLARIAGTIGTAAAEDPQPTDSDSGAAETADEPSAGPS